MQGNARLTACWINERIQYERLRCFDPWFYRSTLVRFPRNQFRHWLFGGTLYRKRITAGRSALVALVQPDNRAPWRREVVITTFASGLVALIVGRGLAYFLPFRSRPRFNSNLHFTMPVGARFDEVLRSWSSFPSDHAMIWMAVSMGIFIVWKRAGFAALAYTLVFICLRACTWDCIIRPISLPALYSE